MYRKWEGGNDEEVSGEEKWWDCSGGNRERCHLSERSVEEVEVKIWKSVVQVRLIVSCSDPASSELFRFDESHEK